jgi:hypothetical protein
MSFDPMSGGLAWDPKKKAERDALRDIEKIKTRVGQIYDSWKVEFSRRAKTRREIIHSLNDLKGKLMAEREYLSQAFPIDATIEMIDTKVATLITIAVCEQNTVKSHVPVTLAATGAQPKIAKFKTIKEFNAIPWIRHFAEQQGFRGFFRKLSIERNIDLKYWIVAVYETDSCLVGELVNDCCWDDFADYDDLGAPEPGTLGALPEPGQTTPDAPTATDTPDAGTDTPDTDTRGSS